MKKFLANYLKTHRKRSGLSQVEVAALLGLQSGTSVVHHERANRRPSLIALLSYEAIFRVPVRDLFAGERESVEVRVKQRARHLLARVEREEPGRLKDQRLRALRALAARI